jgi:hypothetical protein
MNEPVQMSIDVKGLRELQAKYNKSPQVIGAAFQVAQATTAPIIQRIARVYAPRDTGQLHASILVHPTEGAGLLIKTRIGTSLKHAKWQEEGTGVYAGHGRIYPRHAKTLAWQKNGKWVFAKSVAGVKPHWFMKKARTESTPIYRANVKREVESALKQL